MFRNDNKRHHLLNSDNKHPLPHKTCKVFRFLMPSHSFRWSSLTSDVEHIAPTDHPMAMFSFPKMSHLCANLKLWTSRTVLAARPKGRSAWLFGACLNFRLMNWNIQLVDVVSRRMVMIRLMNVLNVVGRGLKRKKIYFCSSFSNSFASSSV